MRKWHFFVWLFLFVGAPFFLVAQRVENLRATFGESKVTIQYDITGGNPKQTFSIQVFGSHNNFSQALRIVIGDVGDGVKGGKDLTIIWDAEAELREHSGAITFRIQGSLIPLPLAFLNPTTESSYRRGKEADIRWEGGVPDQQVKIELYQDTKRIAAVGDAKNSGNFIWNIPKDLDKGEYELKLTSGSMQVTSEAFMVKAKIPMFLKIAPGILAAGAVILLWPDPNDGKLPAAPDPR